MAWTTPRTWTANELVTAAICNTHIRDNLNFLKSAHVVLVHKSANQTLTAGAGATAITFNSEIDDTDTFHDTATNNSRLTVPSGLGGRYWIHAHPTMDADGSNHNRIDFTIRLNGATSIKVSQFVSHTLTGGFEIALTYNLSAGDYVEFLGAAVTTNRAIRGNVDETQFGMVLIGS